MSKPTQDGKKYIQLTDNILLEYTYVKDRYDQLTITDLDDDILGSGYTNIQNTQNLSIEYGTYGRASETEENNLNKYVIARNEYTKEVYFMNDMDSHDYTHNSMCNTVLPVKKDASQWVRTTEVNGEYYSEYDSKWCSNFETTESDLILNPNRANAEYIPYDNIRIYFQNGYHSDYDGFIFNVYTKNYNNQYVNLLCTLHENHDDVYMVSEPMWFADKIYTTYIEYRVPSTAYLSSDCSNGSTLSMVQNGWGQQYDKSAPSDGTLPAFITGGSGFYSNPAIGIDVYAVTGYAQKHAFKILKTRALVSTLFPNKDAYDKLFSKIRNASNGDYYEIYGYYENDPMNPIYDKDSLYEYLSKADTTFTIAHIINVTENWTDSENQIHSYTQPPVTIIQTWENLTEIYEDSNNLSPVIKFRPVLEHTADMLGQDYGATIRYTMRIINDRDSTSVIKTCSTAIIQPRRFGLNLSSFTFNGINNVHVYNRIEQAPSLNINSVEMPVNDSLLNKKKTGAIEVKRYITSSFIDRRNIRVSVSPVKINEVETE